MPEILDLPDAGIIHRTVHGCWTVDDSRRRQRQQEEEAHARQHRCRRGSSFSRGSHHHHDHHHRKRRLPMGLSVSEDGKRTHLPSL